MKIALSDILPNPYRVFNLNPINELKIEKLMESIQETGLWKVIVRPSPTAKGKYELAFGHHRFESAKRVGLKAADFDVQDLTNEQMIKMLARDNDEVYNASMLSIVETVAATVQGLADGSLKPLEISEKARKETIRYAPSFIPGEASTANRAVHPYTTFAVGKLLGYTKKGGEAADAVQAALDVLYLVQVGQIKLEQIVTFSSARQISAFTQPLINRLNEQRIREAKRIKDEAERLRIENERKALQEEQDAIAAAAREKKQAAERKKREAEAADNAKAAAEAEERRKKAEEQEALRILKAHATAAGKALTKYGAPSVTAGAAIEKAVKKATEALEAKDAASAVKLTEQLAKLSRTVTDKYLEQQKLERKAEDQQRKELPTRNAVKALLQKIERIMSDEDPVRDLIKSTSVNVHVTNQERQMLYIAMKSAASRLEVWAEKFAEKAMVNVLVEAEKSSKRTPAAFEQDEADKKKKVQEELDDAAEKRKAERARENAELAQAEPKKKSTKTKKGKK